MSQSVILEELKKTGIVQLQIQESLYLLLDASKSKKFNPSELSYIPSNTDRMIIIDQASKMESYVAELNPMVYDLLEFSEKELLIELPNVIGISEDLISANGCILFRILNQGFLNSILRKHRTALMLVELETACPLPVFSITESLNTDYSIIHLEANGLIKIIRS
jgi:hypothetical protein